MGRGKKGEREVERKGKGQERNGKGRWKVREGHEVMVVERNV